MKIIINLPLGCLGNRIKYIDVYYIYVFEFQLVKIYLNAVNNNVIMI